MAKDNVLFLYVEHKNVTYILFVCDTYLYSEHGKYHGKIMYSNKKFTMNTPFQEKNISNYFSIVRIVIQKVKI